MKVHIDTVSSTNWILNLLFDEIATDIINDPRWPHIGSIRTVHKHVLKSKIGIKSTYGVKILTVAQINIFFNLTKIIVQHFLLYFYSRITYRKSKLTISILIFLFKELLGYDVNNSVPFHSINFGHLMTVLKLKWVVFPMIVISILPHPEIGRNDPREDAPHFINEINDVRICSKLSFISRFLITVFWAA